MSEWTNGPWSSHIREVTGERIEKMERELQEEGR